MTYIHTYVCTYMFSYNCILQTVFTFTLVQFIFLGYMFFCILFNNSGCFLYISMLGVNMKTM